MGSCWNSFRITLRRSPSSCRSKSVFSPDALRRIAAISLGATAICRGCFFSPYRTPGIFPDTRRRRLAFFPVSVRLSAATMISGMAYLNGASHEKAGDRRLLVDVTDRLREQLGDREYGDLFRKL